jgi:hypothetical protein
VLVVILDMEKIVIGTPAFTRNSLYINVVGHLLAQCGDFPNANGLVF